MNLDTNAEAIATLNRIMPDAPPAISPQQQHQAALRDQLTAAQEQLEELAGAIRACDADIEAPHSISAQVAALEQQRADALAAGYLKRKIANVGKLDADIAALKASLEPARTKAEAAAAARAVLVAEQSKHQGIAERLQRDLALSGALGTEAYSRAASSYQQDQRRASAARQQQVARDAEQEDRERLRQEQQRRQNTTPESGAVDTSIPAWLRNRSW